jgi:hypothetical protein
MNMNVTGPVHTDLARIEYPSSQQAATTTRNLDSHQHDHLNMQMVLYNPQALSEQAHGFAEKHHCFDNAAKAEIGAFLTAMLQHHGILPHHYPPGQAYQQHAQPHAPAHGHPHAPPQGHYGSGAPLSEHSQKLEDKANQQMRELEHQEQIEEKVKMAQAQFKMRKAALDFMLQNIG